MSLPSWLLPSWSAAVASGMTGIAVALFVGPASRRFLRERVGSSRTDAWWWLRCVRPLARKVPARSSEPTGVTREAYTVLGAELRAGRSAEAALTAAAAVAPRLHSAARTARVGGDVPAALVELGPDGRALALAWSVGEQAGIGLAALVDRVADGIADDQEIRREVAAQLAGPRATARMLAGLPALGLLLGAGFGDPVGFLLGSGSGIVCLALGTTLAVLGLLWVERLARRARA